MNISMRVACLFFLAFLSHCATPMTVPPNASFGLKQNRFPKSMRLKHRILLEVNGKQYDFVGFLLMQQPDRLYAAAYSEAPAPIFEFKTVGHASAVISKPEMLPDFYLKEGIIEDLLAVFSNAGPVTGNEVWQVQKQNTTDVYRVGNRKRVLSHIELSDYVTDAGFTLPKHMTIRNYRYPYTLDATLLEFTVRPEDETHDVP